MHTVLEQIGNIGIVPVIKIDDAEKAVPLAKALLAGGIPCAEITFRTEAGQEAIRRITQAFPDILVGAGTVLTTAQVDGAIAAGAKFIVSPGFNPKVVAYCIEKEIPIVPGCVTPGEMEQALEMGLEVVKFFPAEQAGGLEYIKAVCAPYTKLRFMPTGGIHAGNLNEYLAFNKIVACGGSWMVKPDWIAQGRFEDITAECRRVLQRMLGFELAHIGINETNAQEAKKAAKQFELMFGFLVQEKSISYFSGSYIEVMKEPYLGKHGHIAIGVNSLARGQAYMERQGFAFRQDTIRKNESGQPVAIYFIDEIAGFAIHLLQK